MNRVTLVCLASMGIFAGGTSLQSYHVIGEGCQCKDSRELRNHGRLSRY